MSLRILHTADWHIGKRLYGTDLFEDHEYFFSQLLQWIESEKITHLLISGDIFDQSNPSAESLQCYYNFIERFSHSKASLIITGGNHDSPLVLNAPQQLLKAFRVHVIGSAPESVSDCILPLKNEAGVTEVVLAAVPFLRDRDLRSSIAHADVPNRIEAVRIGIKNYYHHLAEYCSKNYPGLPAITMGHLYARGAETSESEREIQIGNQAGIDEEVFPETFRYVALGHIHKAQTVGKSGRIRYSGSPIALSFSERNDAKKLILLHIDQQEIKQSDIAVSPLRDFLLLKGSLSDIENEIANYSSQHQQAAYAELQIEEKVYDPTLFRRKDELIEQTDKKGRIKIIYSRIHFLDSEVKMQENDLTHKPVGSIRPQDLFMQLIDDYSPEEKEELSQAFLSLLDQLKEGAEE